MYYYYKHNHREVRTYQYQIAYLTRIDLLKIQTGYSGFRF